VMTAVVGHAGIVRCTSSVNRVPACTSPGVVMEPVIQGRTVPPVQQTAAVLYVGRRV